MEEVINNPLITKVSNRAENEPKIRKLFNHYQKLSTDDVNKNFANMTKVPKNLTAIHKEFLNIEDFNQEEYTKYLKSHAPVRKEESKDEDDDDPDEMGQEDNAKEKEQEENDDNDKDEKTT